MELFEDYRGVEEFLKLAKKIKKGRYVNILNNICVKENTLFFTNLDETLVTKVDCRIEDGLYNLDYNFPLNRLSIKSDDNIEEYPDLPTKDDTFISTIRISEEQRKELIPIFSFCDDKSVQKVYQGVYLSDGKVIATDGKRLYRKFWNNIPENTSIFIVKNPLILEILRKGSNITLYQFENHYLIEFYYEGRLYEYWLNSVGVDYPKVEKVIPLEYRYFVGIPDIKKWKVLSKQIKDLTTGFPACLVKFIDINFAEVYVSKENSKVNQKVFLGKIVWHNNFQEEFKIKFNPIYLMNILETNPVSMHVNSNNTPFGFKYEDSNTISLLMPCLIEEEE